MWLLFAFLAMMLVGIRDPFKKVSLRGNDTLTILFLNTLFCCLLFLPLMFVRQPTLSQAVACMVKALLLMGCWLCSYAGIKHLPITISGLISAFGPVLVVIAAGILFGENLSWLQLCGVVVSFISLATLNRSGKKEGIHFKSDKYIWLMLLSTVFSAGSALFDKLMYAPLEAGGMGLDVWTMQAWYNVPLLLMLGLVLLIRKPLNHGANVTNRNFRWNWTIIAVSACECAADLFSCLALQEPDAMISVISMIRRGSVVVAFLIGAYVFHETNLRSKVFDLLLVLTGLFLLCFGSL